MRSDQAVAMCATKLGQRFAGDFHGALGLARMALVINGKLFVSLKAFARIAEKFFPMRNCGRMIAFALGHQRKRTPRDARGLFGQFVRELFRVRNRALVKFAGTRRLAALLTDARSS